MAVSPKKFGSIVTNKLLLITLAWLKQLYEKADQYCYFR